MRLLFCLSALILSATCLSLVLAAQPNIQSKPQLNHDKTVKRLSDKDISNPSHIGPQKNHNLVLSMNQNTGLNFLPGMANAENVAQPVLTGNGTQSGLHPDKQRFTSKAKNMKNTENDKGPATLPNALWIFGFGIFYILSIRRTRTDES